MKQLIKDVLEDLSKGQVNLSSDAAREMVATTIISAIKTSDRGWVLDLSTLDGKPTNKWSKTQIAKESWICVICGEDTSKVDYDYLVHRKLHLDCALEEEAKGKDIKEQYIEVSEDVVERGKDRRKGDRREKNRSQEKHEEKVFNQAVFGDSRDLTEAKIQANSDHNDGWVKKHYEDKLSEAIVDNKKEKYIYESPDGGKTVYRRKFGEDKRELVDTKEWKKKLS